MKITTSKIPLRDDLPLPCFEYIGEFMGILLVSLVTQTGYYKQGETIVDPSYGWSWTWTHDSYRMTATPDMPINEPNIYDQAGVNEHGFLMSTTNTTTINDKVRAVAPLLREGGFAESLMNTVLLGEAASSAEAIELFGQIVENDGMS